MPAYGPLFKKGAKLAVKYGPQAKLLWDNGGRQAKDKAVDRAAALAARRKAMRKAETVREGLVLKQVHEGATIWVVFAQGRPIEAYPPSPIPLGQLLIDADMRTARTPAEMRAAELHTRAVRVVRERGKPVRGKPPASGPPFTRGPGYRESPDELDS